MDIDTITQIFALACAVLTVVLLAVDKRINKKLKEDIETVRGE